MISVGKNFISEMIIFLQGPRGDEGEEGLDGDPVSYNTDLSDTDLPILSYFRYNNVET